MAGTKEILPKGGAGGAKPAAPSPAGKTLPRSNALRASVPAAPPPSAAPREKGPALSLTWKIFLGTAAVVTTVLGLTLLFTNFSAKRAADQAIDRGLAATSSQVEAFLEGRERGLLNGARVFVQPSPFFSLFEAMEIKREDMLDQAGEAVTQLGADWVQFTDAYGVRLAKSNEPSAPADSLGGSPLIGGALEGREVTGVGLTGDTIVYQAVAVPVRNATSVVGALMATRMIDSLLADSIKKATDSDIVFYALDRDDKPHVSASTLPKSAELTRFLTERLTTRAAAAESSSVRNSAAPDSGANVAARDELQLGTTHYVGQGAPLLSAAGAPYGGFVALRSRDKELAAFREVRKTILLAGALGLALSFVLSFLIANQITKPVASLVAATRRAAEGDYEADIAVRSSDEIGTLADAFRAMLADLRDKQALVEFLSAGDTDKTVMLTRMSGTMAHAAAEMGVASITPGQTFAGRYEIKEILGVGGMGMVYKARDRELDEIVAIKTLKPDFLSRDSTALERFKTEIRLARRISHRNVVRTHDIGDVGGLYYITMEFVEGRSLKDLIKTRGKLPVAATLTIAKQLCRALEVAHEQGVIHRDIKPQNIVVEPDGVLKVMDFGIARLAQRNSGVTQAGMVIGTPEYMAPEQLLGDDVDQRVDLWAAGVVMYECLTGALPFTADTPIVLVTRVLDENPPSPRSLSADVPAPLSDLIMRVLSKDRDQRPRSAEELHDLIAAVG